MKSNANQKIEVDENTRGWKTSLLSDVAVVNEKSINRDFKNENIEYIDVSSTLCGEILETQKLSLKDAPSRAKRIVSDNDILISTVRPNLKHFAFVSKTKPNLIASTGYAVVSSKKVNPRFLYYYLTTEEYTNYLSAIADTTTSTYPAFNPDVLEKSRIPFPSEYEQQQIASILSSLDDKIELNRRMNKTLEEIGKALFKRWFVDFEFPNENGEPYKSSGGEMVESELGEIPKGWEVKPLDQIADIAIGRTPPRLQKEWFSEDKNDVKWVSIKDMGNSGVFINKTAEYLTRKAVKKFNIPVIPANTVIVSFKLTVGRVAITTEEMLSNEAIAHIKANSDMLSSAFIYLTLISFDFSSLGTTSSIATAVNSKSIKGIKILIPQEDLLELFNSLVKPIFEKIHVNSLETDRLSTIRDSLLPRLMSGRLRV